MAESPIERGVIWVGANDGPVHVTRDDGKTWKNVTPKDLPPGGRVQNIDASPIRQGAAYIAVYRYLREHDLKPYIYRTDDYGATWTKLTDGHNGIPADYPTRVVREDPERAGLLYAGTEFGMFVSFDNGGAVAAAAAEPAGDAGHRHPRAPRRSRHRDDGPVVLDHGRHRAAPAAWRPSAGRLTLLRPSTRVRYRRAGGGRGAAPQYPPVALAIDYVLPDGFSGPLTLAIADARGRRGPHRRTHGGGPGTGQGHAQRRDAPAPTRRWRRRRAAAAAARRR